MAGTWLGCCLIPEKRHWQLEHLCFKNQSRQQDLADTCNSLSGGMGWAGMASLLTWLPVVTYKVHAGEPCSWLWRHLMDVLSKFMALCWVVTASLGCTFGMPGRVWLGDLAGAGSITAKSCIWGWVPPLSATGLRTYGCLWESWALERSLVNLCLLMLTQDWVPVLKLSSLVFFWKTCL